MKTILSQKMRRFVQLIYLTVLTTSIACSDVTDTSANTPPLTASFSLNTIPNLTFTPGISSSRTLSLSRDEGFEEAISFEIVGLPKGITATFSENPTLATEVTLNFDSLNNLSASETEVKIKATSESAEKEIKLNLSMQIPSEPKEGLEAYAPGVIGETKTLELNGVELKYTVIDGLAIVGGDMVLGSAEALENKASADTLATMSATCNFDLEIGFACAQWDNGVIGYSFADDWGNEENNRIMRSRIKSAIDHWEENTSIRFVRRSSGQYVEFRNSSGCSSTVGRAIITGFDSQSISLSMNCPYGTVIHEIGHAVGLFHEHSRDDRDDYIKVDFDRIQDFRLHNFFQFGEMERDQGPYDYDSIMHYPKAAFARNASACNTGEIEECTVRPLNGINPDRIGQRSGLSEGDILGAYMLYPPKFTLQGASANQRSNRFSLYLDFTTPTVKAEYINWKSNRINGTLGTGQILELDSRNLPAGEHLITVEIVINSVTVESKSIALELVNNAPSVSIRANNGQSSQQLNQVFTVSASVIDAEDGSCSPEVCEYTWTPAPDVSPLNSAVANYSFSTIGEHVVTLTVEDSSGAVGTTRKTFNIVNSKPTVTLLKPTSSVTQSSGSELSLEASAVDLNELSGELSCSALSWFSSNSTDSFTNRTGCSTAVTLGDSGSRTFTVTATDPQGASDSATVRVLVTACDGNCKPSGLIVLSTPEAFRFNNLPAYYHTTEVALLISSKDEDSPADYPISYLLTEERVPCIGGCGSETILSRGSFSSESDQKTITWQPVNSCTDRRIYDLKLFVTDSRGATNQAAKQTVIIDCNLQ